MYLAVFLYTVLVIDDLNCFDSDVYEHGIQPLKLHFCDPSSFLFGGFFDGSFVWHRVFLKLTGCL